MRSEAVAKALRVVALISFRLPVDDKRGEEIAIARGVGGALHLRCLLIGIVGKYFSPAISAGKGYARFGLRVRLPFVPAVAVSFTLS